MSASGSMARGSLLSQSTASHEEAELTAEQELAVLGRLELVEQYKALNSQYISTLPRNRNLKSVHPVLVVREGGGPGTESISTEGIMSDRTCPSGGW